MARPCRPALCSRDSVSLEMNVNLPPMFDGRCWLIGKGKSSYCCSCLPFEYHSGVFTLVTELTPRLLASANDSHENLRLLVWNKYYWADFTPRMNARFHGRNRPTSTVYLYGSPDTLKGNQRFLGTGWQGFLGEVPERIAQHPLRDKFHKGCGSLRGPQITFLVDAPSAICCRRP